MNSLNNSGMISAIQKPDGSPYDDSATPTPPQKRIVRSKSQTITPQQFPPNYIPSASLNTPKSKTLDEVYLHPKATQMIEAFDKANQLVNDEVLTTTKA